MLQFNLLDERWIPCIRADDGAEEEYSLAGVLVNAHALREIRDSSPLVTAALHRLLLAVIHRATRQGSEQAGPATWEEWRDLWKEGQFDGEQLTRYLEAWRHRFALFGDDRPFYQAASLDFSYERAITNLTHELNTDGTTLFDHTTRANSPAFTPARAARYLVAHQAFAIGGLLSLEKGQDPKLFKSADSAPLTKGAVMLVQGSNLFETLMLNLHRYNRKDDEPFAMDADDAPAWERGTETKAGDRRLEGYLDLLTWQSRRIRLHPTEKPDGTVVVRSVVVMKGNQFPDGFNRSGHETMLAFRVNKKAKGAEDPTPVVSFQPEKALWRDSLTLLQSAEDEAKRPKMLNWLAILAGHKVLDRAQTVPLVAYGLGSDRAKIFFWRTEQLPLPLAYVSDGDLLARVRDALALAEQTGRVLRDAIREFARYVFVPEPSDDLYRQRSKDIAALCAALAPGRRYWSALDAEFSRFVIAQAHEAANRPPGETGELPIKQAFTDWGDAVRAAARDDFNALVGGHDDAARAMKATVQARGYFEGLSAYWRRRAGLDRKEEANGD
jgi:CRISPR system Cascade subunit CasA